RIKHYEWIQMYKRGWDNAITDRNIQSAWKGAGLVPYKPQKLVSHIHEPPPVIQQVPQNT
ncbi:hypothetical protein V1505DRAFT_308425, partial [Lipomyces doorenjongii]